MLITWRAGGPPFVRLSAPPSRFCQGWDSGESAIGTWQLALSQSARSAVNRSFVVPISSGAVPSPLGSPRLAAGFGMACRGGWVFDADSLSSGTQLSGWQVEGNGFHFRTVHCEGRGLRFDTARRRGIRLQLSTRRRGRNEIAPPHRLGLTNCLGQPTTPTQRPAVPRAEHHAA
jgi:hypothetical protein